MRAILIVILSYVFISFSYGQNLIGFYKGELLTKNNLLKIDEIGGKYILEIFNSEKESISVDIIENENQFFKFYLPIEEGEDLELTFNENNNGLVLEFQINGDSFHTIFQRISLPRKNPVNRFFAANQWDFDPLIVGKWKHIKTFNADGSVNKTDGSAGRGYVNSYLNDGRLLLDPQIFRDLDKESGRADFSYQNIPTSSWKTNGQTLLLTMIGGEVEFAYFINQDTLILITPEKIRQVYTMVK